MDNRNTYQPNPYITANGYYQNYYPAAATPMARPEVPAYIMQQVAPAAVLKGRPVSSIDEAKVAQIDLDGSVTFFPDLGNKKIYTKRINVDGTSSLQSYSLDAPIVVPPPVEYATKEELIEIKNALGELLEKLKGASTQPTSAPQKINF